MSYWPKIYQTIHLALRTCPVCGSNQTQEFLLCSFCWHALRIRGTLDAIATDQAGLTVLSTWTWIHDQNRLLSITLDSLKRHPIRSDWKILAACLSEKMVMQKRVPNVPLIFVPCPARGKIESDHATLLCQELANYWDSPMVLPFERLVSRVAQKTKSQFERRRTNFRILENFSMNLIDGNKVIFVDDIFTTGSTALAAHRALGAPPDFEVWCLAHRRLAGIP